MTIFNIGSGGKGGVAHAHKSCGGYFISQTPESNFNVVVLVFVILPSMGCICGMAALKGAAEPPG